MFSSIQCIEFTVVVSEYRARLLYEFAASPATDEFRWYVAATGPTPTLRLTASVYVYMECQYQVMSLMSSH